jgi:hypothetical protein
MARAKRHALLRGTFLISGRKRRRFVFRIDPDGILAVRIGSPLAFSAFLGILLLSYFVGWPTLGWASLLAGGAIGLATLGLLDNGIAMAVAAQPRNAVLKSPMNVFLPKDALRGASVEAGVRVLRVEGSREGTKFVLDVIRPDPGEARRQLAPLLETR